jgi:non-heme chloroperoxidase
MSFLTLSDGTEMYYVEYGPADGQPIIFAHGWPLSSDAWSVAMKYFADRGFRAIAHDRRGHGRSSNTWTGNDLTTYASDLSELVEHLDLHDLIVVGHSTGGGEVVRFAARHGNGRVAKVVTAGAIPPIMVKSDSNPEGLPIAVFDGIRDGVITDASQFWIDLSETFFSANREGSKVSEGAKRDFWRQGMLCGIAPAYDCIKAFSETDQNEDLRALEVPILIAHATDDQIVPIADAAMKSIEIVSKGTLKVYEGYSHGIFGEYQDKLLADILAFIRS